MCGGPKWKREIVPDHKFDFVDTREFTDNGFMMRLKYLWLYILVLKSFLVYISDIFTAITMLTTHAWSNQIFENCQEQQIQGCIPIPFNTGKWLFVGCIIFSFALLGYEARKSKKIIASRDISYAFTNVMANNYYSLRSYDHFCFFDHISNSTKISDDFAFFVFFVFKSWKRVLLADGPRQTINALTLYAIFLAKQNQGPFFDVKKYFEGNKNLSTSLLTVTTFFTVVVFAGSLLLLVVAGICYIPLLCYIRGNLKEYCCHKVDKRISAIIKRRQKQRLADAAKLAQKEAQGDFSHLKNKKGEFIAQPLPQPTLPNISLDDDDDVSTLNTRVAPTGTSSTYTYGQDQYYYNSDKMDYIPPMPAYNPNSTYQAPGAPQFNTSQANFYDESMYTYPPQQGYDQQQMYEENPGYGIERRGTAGPEGSEYAYNSPYGIEGPGTANAYGIERPGTANQYGQNSSYPPERPGTAGIPDNARYNDNGGYDPHDVYQGRTLTSPDGVRRQRSPFSPASQPPSASEQGSIAYDNYSAYSGGSGSTPLYPNQNSYNQPSPASPYSGYSSYSSQGQLARRGSPSM